MQGEIDEIDDGAPPPQPAGPPPPAAAAAESRSSAVVGTWPPPLAATAAAAAAAAAQPNHLPARAIGASRLPPSSGELIAADCLPHQMAIGASAAGEIHSSSNGTAALHACAEGSAEIAKGMEFGATVTNGALRRGRLLEPLASLAGLLLVILLTHIQDPAAPFFVDVVPGP